jgi:hypothetical protein
MKAKVVKPKTCKECKSKFIPTMPLQAICGYECALIATRKHAQKQQAKVFCKEIKEMKDGLKTLSEWKKDLQIEINTIVRLIDKGQPCIATGNFGGKMNAGHYISVGSNNTLRFHLDNIHIQSEHSNSWKSGDTLNYQKGIEATYGKNYLEYMNSLQSIEPLKMNINEVKEAIKKARLIVKGLKQIDKVYEPEMRLLLRNKFNRQLQIYTKNYEPKRND